MRIAYFVSNRTTIPPQDTEIAASTTVVMNIIKHLSKKHDITVYAAKGSNLPNTKIVDLDSPPYQLDSNISADDWITKFSLGMKSLFLGSIFQNSSNYDLIHIHSEPTYLGMPYAHLIKTPVLFTSHNMIHDYEIELYEKHIKNSIHFSALSKAQIINLPSANKIPIIMNSIEFEEIPFSDSSDDYFLYFGRLVKDKGINNFLEIIKLHPEQKFVIAGKGENIFFQEIEKIAKVNKNIQFYGVFQRLSSQWHKLISQAKALIMPINYEDTCPLVPLEAMACGTPVIAYAKGALPEQIIDNKTGFIVNYDNNHIRGNWFIKDAGLTGIKNAMNYINSMPQFEYKILRKNCRRHIEQNFSTQRMAEEYTNLYKIILGTKVD